MVMESTQHEREMFKGRLQQQMGTLVTGVDYIDKLGRWKSDDIEFAWRIWLPTYRVLCEYQSERDAAKGDVLRMASERDEAIARLNTPETRNFVDGVITEAAHQRLRWGSEHDEGKTAEDWFWLLGYLASKALHAFKAGDLERMRHHIITTAAACANWHAQLEGKSDMRPGIMPPPEFVEAAPNGER